MRYGLTLGRNAFYLCETAVYCPNTPHGIAMQRTMMMIRHGYFSAPATTTIVWWRTRVQFRWLMIVAVVVVPNWSGKDSLLLVCHGLCVAHRVGGGRRSIPLRLVLQQQQNTHHYHHHGLNGKHHQQQQQQPQTSAPSLQPQPQEIFPLRLHASLSSSNLENIPPRDSPRSSSSSSSPSQPPSKQPSLPPERSIGWIIRSVGEAILAVVLTIKSLKEIRRLCQRVDPTVVPGRNNHQQILESAPQHVNGSSGS
jgi:hypothetical protein